MSRQKTYFAGILVAAAAAGLLVLSGLDDQAAGGLGAGWAGWLWPAAAAPILAALMLSIRPTQRGIAAAGSSSRIAVRVTAALFILALVLSQRFYSRGDALADRLSAVTGSTAASLAVASFASTAVLLWQTRRRGSAIICILSAILFAVPFAGGLAVGPHLRGGEGFQPSVDEIPTNQADFTD